MKQRLFIQYGIALMLMTTFSVNIFSGFEEANATRFLFQAAAIGDVRAVQEILGRLQWLAHKRDAGGRAPLHVAAAHGHQDVVRVLLDNNCEIDARDKDGRSALHFAAGKGSLKVVRLLLQRGAKIDARDKCGRTPLHFASIVGHLAVAKVLVQNACTIDIEDEESNAPVHYAVFKHLDIVQYLINHGAHVSESVDRNILHQCPDYNWRAQKKEFAEERRGVLRDICCDNEVAREFSRSNKADNAVITGALRQILAEEGTRDSVKREELSCPICQTELSVCPVLDIMPVCSQSPLHVVCYDCSLRMTDHGVTRCPICRGPLL